MANEIFVDTSGFYALLVARDDRHETARQILRKAAQHKRRFVTTDYVLDETATLLKARRHGHLLKEFFEMVLTSKACTIEWTDAERFVAAQALFLKHLARAWSFTDCLSMHVMQQLGLREALTKDAHFREAGFGVLLNR